MKKMFLNRRMWSLIISVVMILSACAIISSPAMAETTPTNILRDHLESAQCLLQNRATGDVVVDSSNRFDMNGALGILCDGDTATRKDVYGAKDWETPQNVGALLTLDQAYDVGKIKLYSGMPQYTDYLRVYASDNLGTLYAPSNMLGDNIACNGSAITVEANKSVKYIAVFITDYYSCGRIYEVEAYNPAGTIAPPASTVFNLTEEHLESAQCVLQTIATGEVAVDSSNRFNMNGALDILCDGDTSTRKDVYGAKDWEVPRYVGAQITFDQAYDVGKIKLYSGMPQYTDYLRVYASDNLENLYSPSNMIADNLACNGAAVVVDANKSVKYIAVFITDYVSCGRIYEVEVYTADQSIVVPPSNDPVNLTEDHLESKQCILQNIETGTVEIDSSNRFNSKGGLDILCDGNVAARVDVYGAKDWEVPRYVGALLTLDQAYQVNEIKLYFGVPQYTDYLRVYASDSMDNLYTDANKVADNVACNGAAVVVNIQKAVKYVAVLITDYNGCGRAYEVEIIGAPLNSVEGGLHVEGNQLMVGEDAVALRGVNVPHYCWSANGDGKVEAALNQAISWNCSIVRLAVDPVLFVNGGVGNGSGQSVSKTAAEYQAQIDACIDTLTENNIAVVLDCHAYAGAYDDVYEFWDIAAARYNDNDMVMYGLLNEPISQWGVWYEGGTVTLPNSSNQVTSIGIPALLDRVRALSDNVVVIGGIDWAFDVSGISTAGLNAIAAERAPELGISAEQYVARYSLLSAGRKGRGIVLDTHIYSHKSMDWDGAIGEANEEYPILVGEYNPYYRNGIISTLNAQEKSFYQRIFRWITENGYSSTAWSFSAEPFLTDHNGNITALGTAVREFVQTGAWQCDQVENLLYQQFESAVAISRDKTTGIISNNNTFINQAFDGSERVGRNILSHLIDSDTLKHYDINAWDNHEMGVQYEMDDVYAGFELKMTSGLASYPDRYYVFASDRLENLYDSDSIVENCTTDHTGTVSYTIDRPVKYVAFLADGHVRIKEISLNGAMFGDFNANRSFDAQDLVSISRVLLGVSSQFTCCADVNRDGCSNILDLIRLKKQVVA